MIINLGLVEFLSVWPYEEKKQSHRSRQWMKKVHQETAPGGGTFLMGLAFLRIPSLSNFEPWSRVQFPTEMQQRWQCLW